MGHIGAWGCVLAGRTGALGCASVGRIGALVQVFAWEAHRNFPLMAA